MNTGDIVDILGGNQKLAAVCRVTDAAISQWRSRGIPLRHWTTLVDFAGKNKIPDITHKAIQAARRRARALKRRQV